MLSFMYNFRHDSDILDVRALPTRRHDLFKEIHIAHHKVRQDPLYRAILSWNGLQVDIRNAETKEKFKKALIAFIPNPYKTIT